LVKTNLYAQPVLLARCLLILKISACSKVIKAAQTAFQATEGAVKIKCIALRPPKVSREPPRVHVQGVWPWTASMLFIIALAQTTN